MQSERERKATDWYQGLRSASIDWKPGILQGKSVTSLETHFSQILAERVTTAGNRCLTRALRKGNLEEEILIRAAGTEPRYRLVNFFQVFLLGSCLYVELFTILSPSVPLDVLFVTIHLCGNHDVLAPNIRRKVLVCSHHRSCEYAALDYKTTEFLLELFTTE